MRVRCHCQHKYAFLVSLKPCSIQARKPYHAAVLASRGKSVTSYSQAAPPAPVPNRLNKVQA